MWRLFLIINRFKLPALNLFFITVRSDIFFQCNDAKKQRPVSQRNRCNFVFCKRQQQCFIWQSPQVLDCYSILLLISSSKWMLKPLAAYGFWISHTMLAIFSWIYHYLIGKIILAMCTQQWEKNIWKYGYNQVVQELLLITSWLKRV